jgi:integrase/recombinase XerC
MAGYLRKNPWKTVKTPKAVGKRIKVNRALNQCQWAAVIRELESMTPDEVYFRLRWVLWLGYSTGLRLDEMVRLVASNLRRAPDGHWELVFLGKGGQEREVPLARKTLNYLQDYMESRGHGRDLLVGQAHPC